VGYDHDSFQSKVLAIVADGELREEITAGTDAIVVLDKTPFYAEMGGQIADHGTIDGFTVTDVQKNKGGKYLHYGRLVAGSLRVGDTVCAMIDTARRQAIRRAHSATHLLDAALKKVLGEHVHQAGSLVEPDRLRFDFSHFEAVTAEELHQIEALVNEWILTGYPVVTEVLPIEEAKKKGAVAMFGEKYGDVVRVVEMGSSERCVSMEFCGGTHLDNTAKAGAFRITSEGSVASGVRRIEATTGEVTYEGVNRERDTLRAAAAALKTTPGELGSRIEQILSELKEAKRLIEQYKAKESAGGAADLLKNAADVGGLHVVTTTLTSGDVAALRTMGDMLRDKDPAVVAVIALSAEKLSLLAVCGKEAVAKGVKAGDIIKSIAPIVGGKGGGKPDSAMGGGSDKSKVAEALAAVKPFVEQVVG
ncbi:MAG: alanine--tRNA ligase, partial [Oscillospiraceae bacterium]|nr:alanine--tRNA ligase [Oscillospiraceae bacterium]